MRLTRIACVILFVIALNGCKKSESTQTSNPSGTDASQPATAASPGAPTKPGSLTTASSSDVKPKLDSCALLTSDDIKAIQGEPLKETKLSGRSEGGFSVSQCFYSLPTFTNSISLTVTQRGEGADARDPKEFWKNTFGGEGAKEKGDRDRERGEEERGSTPPLKVAGIGDQAFWLGSRVGGALYVLKGNNFVRLSVGGSGDQASKIKKSKALLQKVLARI